MTSRPTDSLADDIRGTGPEPSPPPDLTGIVGSRFNTNQETREIARLMVSERDGMLVLNIEGAGLSERISWSESLGVPYAEGPGSAEVTGFETHCDYGFMEMHLAADLKYSVMVIQSYNRFKDGSGRPPYLTREFFHQDVVHELTPACSTPNGDREEFILAADVPSRSGRIAPVDLGELTGCWKNTKRATRVIRELSLTKNGDAFELTARGAGAPRDWGTVAVVPHAAGVDAHDPADFLAVYEFGYMQMVLAANMNKGLMIIASYNAFRDGSRRSNYFSREFFYRADR